MGLFTNSHGSLKLEDASTLSITIDDVGDFKADGITQNQTGKTAVMHRKRFVGYVEGDEKPITGSFSFSLAKETLTDASGNRPLDAIRKTGKWAAGTSTNDDTAVWALKGTYTLTAGGVTTTVVIDTMTITASTDESGDVVRVSCSFEGFGCTLA